MSSPRTSPTPSSPRKHVKHLLAGVRGVQANTAQATRDAKDDTSLHSSEPGYFCAKLPSRRQRHLEELAKQQEQDGDLNTETESYFCSICYSYHRRRRHGRHGHHATTDHGHHPDPDPKPHHPQNQDQQENPNPFNIPLLPSSPAPTRSAYAEIPRTGRRNAHVLTLTLRARESETGWSEGLAQEDDLMDAEAHAAGRVDSVAGAWSLEELHEPKMGAEAGVRDVDFACDEPVETRLLLALRAAVAEGGDVAEEGAVAEAERRGWEWEEEGSEGEEEGSEGEEEEEKEGDEDEEKEGDEEEEKEGDEEEEKEGEVEEGKEE